MGVIGVDPRYYLDEMSQDEVVAIMRARNENYSLISREAWEQSRLQCFYSVTAMGAKVRQPKELFKLPWDGDKKEVKRMTKEEALRKLKR